MELMERQLVAWCPELLEEHERGREARAFVRVVEAVAEFSPRVEIVRPGVCSMRTRGPSRYFGGDEALAVRVAEAVAGTEGARGPDGRVRAGIGIADGLFAAVLAAQKALDLPAPRPVVVGPGDSAEFLGPLSVAVLDRPDLADLLCRLGITTLERFAALPARQVLARFGADGAVCRAVAAGIEGELPGLRLPSRGKASSGPGRIAPCVPVRQTGFFGVDAGAQARASKAVSAVGLLLGPEGVLRGRLQGGRGPADRARLVPWVVQSAGDDPAPAGRFRGNVPRARRDGSTTVEACSPPWPGQIPPPSPVLTLDEPVPAHLVSSNGEQVVVSAGGMTSSVPVSLSIAGGALRAVAGWAGPWPCDERWWSRRSRRRQARMQVVTADGDAYLLVCRRGWWVEGIYD
jgi:protein ImuB